jgi:carboxylesterase
MATHRLALRFALVGAAALLSVNCVGRRAMNGETDPYDRHPETGVIRGAESVAIDRGRERACLLLHGWLTGPPDFGDLPAALDEAGWDVYVPRLKGHGTRPADLRGITADAWLEDCRGHLRRLRARYETVALGGFSMGGTISTILAAEEQPDRLLLVCPFYGVTYKWHYILPPRWWARILAPLLDSVPRPGQPGHLNRRDRADEVIMYRAFPTEAVTALFELRRRAWNEIDHARLDMPKMVLYASGDGVAAASATERFLSELPGPTEAKCFERSDHLLMLDWDREAAIEEAVRLLAPSRPRR